MSADPNLTETQRAAQLFSRAQNEVYRRTDRMFSRLLILQWIAGIAAALWISPTAWTGSTSQIHGHVWAALFLGGAISLFPAFLAFYRDWRVMLTATLVVAADHFTRGWLWPESVFGVLTPSHWRWLEHAGWVLFEDAFLLLSMRQTLEDMWGDATRQARLEVLNAQNEHQVAERTLALSREIADREDVQQHLRMLQSRHDLILDSIGEGIYWAGNDGRIVSVNPAAAKLLGWTVQELVGRSAHLTMHHTHTDGRPYPKKECRIHQAKMDGRGLRVVDEVFWRKDGTSFPVEYTSTPLRDEEGEIFGVVVVFSDVTQRKQAEAKLENVNKQLLSTSRQAGMAEVATNVLHNVGNVLNSVNVSADAVALKVRDFRVGKLKSVAALLNEHSSNLPEFLTTDPRGQALPTYLMTLAETLAEPQNAILQEVESLRDNIDHIKGVVAMQQSYARRAGVLESFLPVDLVEDAIRINSAGLTRHEVRLERDFDNLPAILTDRHKVLQILVNLLSNAKYALEHAGSNRHIRVTIKPDGEEGVRISVIDNGVGISAEHLGRMFQHGFTTKKDGHGFGLHSGALAAQELGGRLTAHSDGHGLGATFTLELPFKNHAPRP